jgi:ABC-type transporter Mla subunit MlaD
MPHTRLGQALQATAETQRPIVEALENLGRMLAETNGLLREIRDGLAQREGRPS